MPRKNTAEAFEVLYRIAEERKKVHRATRERPGDKGSAPSAAEAGSNEESGSGPAAVPASMTPVERGASDVKGTTGAVEILGRGAQVAHGEVLQTRLPRVWGKEQFPLVKIPREPLLKGPAPPRKSLASLWGLPSHGPFVPAGSVSFPASAQGRGSFPGQWMAASLHGTEGRRPYFRSERQRSQGYVSSPPWMEAEVASPSGPAAPWKREALDREWAARRSRGWQGAPVAGGEEAGGNGAACWTAPGSLDPLASSEAPPRHERWLEAQERAALLSASEPVCAACGAPCHHGTAQGREAAEAAEATGGGHAPETGGCPPDISCLEAKAPLPTGRRRRRSYGTAGGPPAAPATTQAALPDGPAARPGAFPETRTTTPMGSTPLGSAPPERAPLEGNPLEEAPLEMAPAQPPPGGGAEPVSTEATMPCVEAAPPGPPSEGALPGAPAPTRAASSVRSPAGVTAACSAALPGGRASAAVFFRLRAKLAEWLLGGSLSAKLERRIEVKFSTVLGFTMAAVTTVFVILIYLQTPSKEDPRFASLESSEGTAWRSLDASAPAEGLGPGRGPSERGELPEMKTIPAVGRPRPIPSPGSSSPSLQGSLEGRASEVRNVENAAPGPEAAPAPARVAPPQRVPDAASSPYVYLIQVRAKESEEGAKRIIEYLREFGFQDGLVQTDPRGDRNAEGQPLHTVFVGNYFDKDEAEREAERLKRETRSRPYKGKAGFFQDALVITRRR